MLHAVTVVLLLGGKTEPSCALLQTSVTEALERISKHKVGLCNSDSACCDEGTHMCSPASSDHNTNCCRLRTTQGVEGVLIAGNDGQIHKTTLSEQMTQEYASQIPSLAELARNVVRDLDAQVSNMQLPPGNSGMQLKLARVPDYPRTTLPP